MGPNACGHARQRPQPVGDRVVRRHQALGSKTAIEQAAYSKWLDERSAREDARSDCIHGAIGVIPLPLWLVLFFTLAVVFAYTLFFADSGERAVVQALLMGTVVAVIVAMLLLLQFLNSPFHEGIGGLRPDAMDRTLKITIRSSLRPNENCRFPATSKAIRCRSTRHGKRFGPAPCTP
jgi:succinate dehydrogenase/fumarate reductase cytochrome b subunit